MLPFLYDGLGKTIFDDIKKNSPQKPGKRQLHQLFETLHNVNAHQKYSLQIYCEVSTVGSTVDSTEAQACC